MNNSVGKIEINGIKTKKLFDWVYSGSVRKMLPMGEFGNNKSIPGQIRGGTVVIKGWDFLQFELQFECNKLWWAELDDIKFYYGASGVYLTPSKGSHLIYKGQFLFVVNGSMIKKVEKE